MHAGMNECKDHYRHVQTWKWLDPPVALYHIQALVRKRSGLPLGQCFSPWSSRQMTRELFGSFVWAKKRPRHSATEFADCSPFRDTGAGLLDSWLPEQKIRH